MATDTRQPEPPVRAGCLAAALAAVSERAGAYGAPAPFFAAVARRWSLTLGVAITPRQAVLCLLDLKLARAVAGASGDTCIDIAGYAALLLEIDSVCGPPA